MSMIGRRDAGFVKFLLDNIEASVVVADCEQPDSPLVFVNQHFLAMTGYSEGEVIGRNCRFLQGPDTDPNAIQRIRDAVAEGKSLRLELLNYRKDGTPFWNELNLLPAPDAIGGPPRYYMAMQFPADEKRAHKRRILNDVMGVMDL